MQPKPKSLQEAILRRASDLAGGVSYLAKHLQVSATDDSSPETGECCGPAALPTQGLRSS